MPDEATAARVSVRSLILVPLLARGRALGVLSLISGKPGRYGEADLDFAQELANRAALALDNAQLLAARQAALTEMRRVQARLEAVLNQLPVAVWIAELRGPF